MGAVTYKSQPAIQKTLAHMPSEGYKHPYTVSRLLWPSEIEDWIVKHIVGSCLHVCCGKSELGDCRLDLYELAADVRADAARLPFGGLSWDTVLIDPPYNGVFQWNHDMLSELARVARRRIIFQHWFLPTDRKGRFKKSHRFLFALAALWQPRTYFGRANIITVMDAGTEDRGV